MDVKAGTKRVRDAGRVGDVPVAGPILLAVATDFVFEVTVGQGIGVVAFAIVALLAYLYGRWIGTRTWPKRGRSIARRVLRYNTRKSNHPTIFLTDRPDVTVSIARRIVEVVGFAAGAAIIFTVALTFIPEAPGTGILVHDLKLLSTTLFTFIALWCSFVIVPYWVFGRMGLRQIDPIRWLVHPMAHRYASRLKLSNGALILVAFVAIFNLAYRGGADQSQAIAQSVLTLVRVVMGVLIAAVTAVAYYVRGERGLVLGLEEEALEMGIVDGRDMTDGEFLPKLPKH
ncbi:MAG: hypothetical protein QOE90_1551 [Thermoplasmata archaeon]|nr:hypothetical protein [Thermoplasmata archaeon]